MKKNKEKKIEKEVKKEVKNIPLTTSLLSPEKAQEIIIKILNRWEIK